MTGLNKSVWFYSKNKDYVQDLADKEKKTFNKKVNEIIEEKRKKEV